MDLMDRPRSERETNGAQTRREELVERVARAVGEDGAVEAPGGLLLLRGSSPTPKDHAVSSPALFLSGPPASLIGSEPSEEPCGSGPSLLARRFWDGNCGQASINRCASEV